MRAGYVAVSDKHGAEWVINQDRIYFIEIPSDSDVKFTVHGFGKSIELEFNTEDECVDALAELIAPPSLPSGSFL